MKRTRILILMICLLMTANAALLSFANSTDAAFSDVKQGDWFAELVNEAAGRGIVSGYPDGTFKPSKQVSYAEFLAMSMNLEKFKKLEAPAHWAESYYREALRRGIISESDFTMKDLDKAIPRKHMALILAGLVDARDQQFNIDGVSFSDIAGNAYIDKITLCSAAGVLSGYPDGSFRPEGLLTRSEAAAAVLNYIRLIESELILGGEVEEIYENGNILISHEDGSYEMYYGHDTFMKVDPPDPNEDVHAKTLMRKDHKDILDQVLASAKITGTPGNYTFTYTQPQIPDQYHFAVDLHVYDENDEGGTPTLFFKNSDDGWVMHRENYDPSAKTVTIKIDGVPNLKGKSVVFRLDIYDILDEYTLEAGEGACYVFSTNFDGTYKFLTEASRFHNGEVKYYKTFDNTKCPAFCW